MVLDPNTLPLDDNSRNSIGGYDPISGNVVPIRCSPSGDIVISGLGGNGIESDITSDVWGTPRVVQDYSIFHGLFSFNIHQAVWLIFENGTELLDNEASTRVQSILGEGNIKSGTSIGNSGFLRSRRHPRYQPNRGHKFSTAVFLDDPTAVGIRDFGLINEQNAVCFKLEDGVLYAYIFSNGAQKYKEVIDLSLIGLTINDLNKGHLYDIQYQWRGVGDYFFYIDLKLVHTARFLGTATNISVINPALPVGYKSTNTNGTEVKIRVGCCDITSEGGIKDDALYSSISNTAKKLTTIANAPVLIIHVLPSLNGLVNSRDVIALRSSIRADQKGFFKCYQTRDSTAITNAVFTQKPQSSVEYDVSATAINTSKCQLLWNRGIEVDQNLTVDNPSDFTNFYITAGDYLIFACERENPTQAINSIISVEMGEEI